MSSDSAPMLVIDELNKVPANPPYPVLSIGAFDGIHRGHQAIINRLLERAREKQGTAIVLSFNPHPQRIITPATAPPLLQTAEQRESILRQMGVDVLFRLPFSREISLQPPDRFVSEILFPMEVNEIVVGANFRFGHKRSGDVHMLSALTKRRKIKVHSISPLEFRDIRISSTRIRDLLREGRVEVAGRMLSRPYEIRGTVVRGAGKGATLGFPTANLEPENELIPPVGVYAGWARLRTETRPCVVNIGYRPTLYNRPADRPVIEAHLLAYEADLYGTSLRIDFCARLRNEKRFASLEQLQKQIEKDIRVTQKYFARSRLHLQECP